MCRSDVTGPPPQRTNLRLLALSHTGLLSGAELVLLRALLAARQRGWAVRCLCPPGPFADRLREEGVTVLDVPDLKLANGPRPLAAALAGLRAMRVARVLRRATADGDVLLVNGLLGLPAARLARPAVPVVLLGHDIIARADWRALLRLVAPVVTLALPVSEPVARPLRAAGIATRIVRNGTAWPVEAAPPAAARPPVVGCAGALTPWKGQAVLLEAVAGLPGVQVELAGAPFPKDTAYAEQLAARIAQPDLAGRARLLGRVADVPHLLHGWSVAVVPSTDPDPTPLALLEAMSVGVPVVATDHGGPPEYLGDGGVLVPPGDVEALRAALSGLLADAELRARYGAAGRRRVAEHYRRDERIGELLDVLAGTAGVPG